MIESWNLLRWQTPTFIGIAVRVGVAFYVPFGNPSGVDAAGLAFLVGLTAFSCVPYFVTYFLTTTNRTRGAAAASATLAADLFGVYVGLVQPQGSTAGLAIVIMPLWNLILIIPIAFVLSTVIQRVHKHLRKT